MANKGVILVSEAFTEINAGLVIVLASGHCTPIQESDLVDPERDQMNLPLLPARPTLTMSKATYRPPNRLVTQKLPFPVVC